MKGFKKNLFERTSICFKKWLKETNVSKEADIFYKKRKYICILRLTYKFSKAKVIFLDKFSINF